MPPRRRHLIDLGSAGIASLLAACARPGSQTGLLSEAPLDVKPIPTTTPAAFPPVRLPADEAPHNVLAEWWYYTGHLYPEDAPPESEYGFELVFFRGIRGQRPPGYAAHFAVTDVPRRQFAYDQRVEIALNEAAEPRGLSVTATAPQPRPPGIVALTPVGGGFDMAMGDWWLRGGNGIDRVRASMLGYSIDLSLVAQKPPALHTGSPPIQPGLISFGPAGYSYYYSRTRMEVQGGLTIDGVLSQVRGDAWMDHQWGDFLVLGGGGWDWFAASLRDGREVTISVIRDASGSITLAYGSLVTPAGETRHLAPGSFTVTPTATWRSDKTGVTYPSGWEVRVPAENVGLALTPLLQDQELDTRASTGVIYWEGAVTLQDIETGEDAGRGYVELTGYSAKK
jgi:predicted secreted hydrolase